MNFLGLIDLTMMVALGTYTWQSACTHLDMSKQIIRVDIYTTRHTCNRVWLQHNKRLNKEGLSCVFVFFLLTIIQANVLDGIYSLHSKQLGLMVLQVI